MIGHHRGIEEKQDATWNVMFRSIIIRPFDESPIKPCTSTIVRISSKLVKFIVGNSAMLSKARNTICWREIGIKHGAKGLKNQWIIRKTIAWSIFVCAACLKSVVCSQSNNGKFHPRKSGTLINRFYCIL